MDTKGRSPRIELVREAAVLQIKLLVDGLRDAVLVPISLLATLIGLLRGGADCDREFRRVIKLGRRSERWINLFGHQRPLPGQHGAGSMDSVLDQVESAVKTQYQRSRTREGEPPAEHAAAIKGRIGDQGPNIFAAGFFKGSFLIAYAAGAGGVEQSLAGNEFRIRVAGFW